MGEQDQLAFRVTFPTGTWGRDDEAALLDRGDAILRPHFHVWAYGLMTQDPIGGLARGSHLLVRR